MMRNLFVCLLFSLQLFSQTKKVSYNFGCEGIDMIAKTKTDSTIVYSDIGAKPTIRREVSNNIVKLYTKGLLKNGLLTVKTHSATISGKIKIKRKGKLISIMFSWKIVKWRTGLVEEYCPIRKRK